MGRVSRHKKIKAIDPFSKASLANRGPGGISDSRGDGFVLSSGPGDSSSSKGGANRNLAPKKTEPNNIPRKLRELMALKAKAEAKANGGASRSSAHGEPAGKKSAGPAPASDKPHLVKMEPLPGESMFSFRKRVRRELKKRLQELKSAKPISTVKAVSESRKEYLDARAEAKRRKKLGLPAEAPLPPHLQGEGGDSGDRSSKGVVGGKRKRPDEEHAAAAAAARPGSKRPKLVGADHDDDDEDGGSSSNKRPRHGAQREEWEKTDEFPTADGTFSFGDRAERPPELKAQPRKSKKQREAEALHKVRQWAASKAAQIAASGAADDTVEGGRALERAEAAAAKAERAEAEHSTKARQEAVKKAQMEELRAQAQAAYAALKKKRREEESSIYRPKTSSASGSKSGSGPSSSSSSSSSSATMGALRAGAAITAGFKPPQAS